MLSKSLFRRLALSVALSVGALSAAVAIQGFFRFPMHIGSLHSPLYTYVRRLSIAGDGQHAAAVLMQSPLGSQLAFKNTFRVCKPGGIDNPLRGSDLGFTPWTVVGTRGGEGFFVSSSAGDLYWLDLSSSNAEPQRFGTHAGGCVAVLECTFDGSIVVAGNTGSTSAFRRDTQECLWYRSDISVISAHFHAQSSRLFCGLLGGTVVELDPCSGATLRTFDAHCEGAIALDVSADGRCLAAMSHYGICGVIDLMTNQRLWSKHLPWPPAGPQFSPDGKLLVTSSPDGVQCVHVLSSATGLVVAELTGMKQAVAGIEITSSGTVYAWDFFGTITAWDLASRRLLHKSSIECTRADRGSL